MSDKLTNEQVLAYIEQHKKDGWDGRERLKAPKGRYRVVGVDTFEGPRDDFLMGDFDVLEDAKEEARYNGGEMNVTYVFDDEGNTLARFGSV